MGHLASQLGGPGVEVAERDLDHLYQIDLATSKRLGKAELLLERVFFRLGSAPQLDLDRMPLASPLHHEIQRPAPEPVLALDPLAAVDHALQELEAGYSLDDEPEPHVAPFEPREGLVHPLNRERLDVGRDAVLAAEVEHLLGLLDAADVGARQVRHAATRRIKELIELVAREVPEWGQPGAHERALVTVATMVGALMLARAVDDTRLSDALREA